MADITPGSPSEVDYCQDVFLTTGQIVGLSFTAQAGFISAMAVVILLTIVAMKYIKRVRDPVNPSLTLIRTNIDGLMLNLLIADLFMSLGAIFDVEWASSRKVSCGAHCNAQGAIQIVGETAVALFTLSITLLTFISIFRGRAVRSRFAVWGGIAGAVWLFVLLWAVIGYATHVGERKDSFYAPTPYWCWISEKYKAQRLLGEYIWLWIAGFGAIFLYTPLFLMLRGNILWEPGLGWRSFEWRWRPSRAVRRSEGGLVDSKDAESVVSVQGAGTNPFTLLWYPLAYTIVVLPVSIVRWTTFNDKGTPSPDTVTATFVTISIFNLSGLVNVVLILFTRTNVLLLGPGAIGTPGNSNSSLGHGRSGNDDVRYLQDVGAPPPDTASDHARGETGFGGPRVILRDNDPDFDSGRINRAVSQEAPTFVPSPSPRRDAELPQSEMSALGLTGLRVEGAPKGPGKIYLESLGLGRGAKVQAVT